MSACVWPYVLFLVLADRFKNQNRPKSIVRDHVPSEWLKGEVSLQEIKDCYSLCYGGDICNHPSLKRGLKCDVEWDKIIPLLNRDDITFKKLDSGFCSGIVAFKDGDVKAHVVTSWRKPLNGNKIKNSVRNASSDVAIAGARSCLDKVEGLISNYPNVREWIVKSSHHAMALRLSNQFRIDLCEDFLFSPPHNYDFHRAAYDVKALAGQYQKNSMEWAASLILMAAFSLLGSEPSVERDVQWKRIVKMWHPVIYKPDNDKIVAWYDPRSEMLWIRGS